tara:strand:+ start:6576 stop:6899 length:324 start_codon:yes stop_codon:yes gene_type:complete
MSSNTAYTNSGPASTARPSKYNLRTDAEKEAILREVEDFDAEHGRGGAVAVARKHGVAAANIYLWRKKYEVCPFKGSEIDEHLKRLTDIRKEIASLQAEYDNLKSKI